MNYFFRFGQILFNLTRTFAAHHEKSFVPASVYMMVTCTIKRAPPVPSFWHLTYYWMGHIFLLNSIFSVACVAGVKSGRVRENSSARGGGGGKRNAPCWHFSPSPTSIPPPLPILTSATRATFSIDCFQSTFFS